VAVRGSAELSRSLHGFADRFKSILLDDVFDGNLVSFVVIQYFRVCISLSQELAHTSSPRFPAIVTVPIFEIEFFSCAARDFFCY
jgi:hypothetical protein